MFGVRRMRGRRLGTALCALGYALALLCLILSATLHVGGDWKLYHRLQRRAGILGEAGVSEGDLLRLDEWLADYLGGNAKPQIEIDVFGARQLAFNDREMGASGGLRGAVCAGAKRPRMGGGGRDRIDRGGRAPPPARGMDRARNVAGRRAATFAAGIVRALGGGGLWRGVHLLS